MTPDNPSPRRPRRRRFPSLPGAAWLVLLAPATLGAQPGVIRPMHHATGTFEVTITPEGEGPPPPGGVPVSRMGITKRFTGGLDGTAAGTMIAAGTPRPGVPAAYVALDQFRGRVDGRAGGFLLIHRGTMTRAGEAELQVVVAPDSGTGALAGIAGSLAIRVEGGRHFYDFAYTLPAAD